MSNTDKPAAGESPSLPADFGHRVTEAQTALAAMGDLPANAADLTEVQKQRVQTFFHKAAAIAEVTAVKTVVPLQHTVKQASDALAKLHKSKPESNLSDEDRQSLQTFAEKSLQIVLLSKVKTPWP